LIPELVVEVEFDLIEELRVLKIPFSERINEFI
jgi:hypothetical protein